MPNQKWIEEDRERKLKYLKRVLGADEVDRLVKQGEKKRAKARLVMEDKHHKEIFGNEGIENGERVIATVFANALIDAVAKEDQ